MLASLVGTWLIVAYLGADQYAAVLLISGLSQLLPFADFGVGAAVINTIAATNGEAGSRHHLFGVLVSAQRILATGGATLIVIGSFLAITHLWGPILGAGANVLDANINVAALTFICVFATYVFMQLGYRILTGAGKNHVGSLLAGGASVLSLALTALGVVLRFSPVWFIVSPTLASIVMASVACVIGTKLLDIKYWSLLRAIPRVRKLPQISLRSTAIPMVVILVALPILVFSHRIILSHVSTPQMLSEYAVASQVYAPAWGVVTSTLIALWPVFASARPAGTPPSIADLRRPLAIVSSAALVGAICFTLLLPPITSVIGHGQATASWSLSAAFASLLFVQATFYPIGVYLTQAHELRFQAWCVIVMLVVCLPLSIAGAALWGATGPVVVTALAIFIFQLIPAVFYIRRRDRQYAA